MYAFTHKNRLFLISFLLRCLSVGAVLFHRCLSIYTVACWWLYNILSLNHNQIYLLYFIIVASARVIIIFIITIVDFIYLL